MGLNLSNKIFNHFLDWVDINFKRFNRAHEVGELRLVAFCESNIRRMGLALRYFRETFDFLFPCTNLLLTILIFVFLRRNNCSQMALTFNDDF